jgi:glutamine amidotransferase
MQFKVVIVDYGAGNVSSVKRSLARIGVDSTISSEIGDIESSDKLILAGVGHFERAVANLKRTGLWTALEKAVLVDRKPVLGICLGMELMAKTSEEGRSQGLGWFDAKAVRFQTLDRVRYKTPHVGWNTIKVKKDSRLMRGIPDSSEFYFLHSYYLRLDDRSDMLNETEYETMFPAAIERDNIFGVQYHPEKSHAAGLQLLKNFIEL